MSNVGAIGRALAARGGTWVDLAALLPAPLVLELAGEDLRARLYFATGPDGQELCLRADLTIPAALRYLDERPSGPTAWLHEGKVFRAPREGEPPGAEFLQIGLERYGDPDEVEADCGVVLAALEACAAGGLEEAQLTLSDGDLLRRVLAGADLPEPWGEALRAESGRPGALERRLDEAAGITPPLPTGQLEQALTLLDAADAETAVSEVLGLSRLTLGPGRTAADIATRLVSKARRAKARPLDPDRVEAIRKLLAVSGSARPAIADVVGIARTLGVDLASWAQDWAIRLDALAAATPKVASSAVFRAGRRRNFAYYSGLFFDVTAGPGHDPAASGGRYDGLVAALSGGAVSVAAVGCVVRPQRLSSARGAIR